MAGKGLMNYTTEIAVEKTVGELQAILARHGALSISIEYAEGNPAGVFFVIPTAFGNKAFRLPNNMDAVYRVMDRQAKQGKIPRKYVTRNQAARVGWRIIKDSIEARLAIVETEMVALEEELLAYMLMAPSQTLYELMTKHQLALPPGREE